MANYGTITGTSYMDTELMAMTKYYYRVKAANSAGTGDPSDGMAYAMTDTSNTAPMAVGTIAAVSLTAGETAPAMDVSGYFSDADMDDLTYGASSSSPAVATVSVDGSMVTISALSRGSATITVTASDGMGGMNATQPIAVTVNGVPATTNNPDLQLPTEVSLTVGQDDRVITLTGSYVDPDEDDLTYTATSSDDAIATATVSEDGTMLTIAAVSAGMATVTVTADDGNGGTATHDIAVTVDVDGVDRADGPCGCRAVANTQSINVTWDPCSIQNAVSRSRWRCSTLAVTELAAGLITIVPGSTIDGSATFNACGRWRLHRGRWRPSAPE